MKKSLLAEIPGLRFKHSMIIDALKMKEEGHLDLLAYLAFVDDFKAEIAHEQSLYDLLDCSGGLLFVALGFWNALCRHPRIPE